MIDPVEEGINPNPLSWNEILWPVKDNPPIKTSADLVEYLQEEYPYVDVEDVLIEAFHYMMERWDRPASNVKLFGFIEKWVSVNNERAKRAKRFFPGANR